MRNLIFIFLLIAARCFSATYYIDFATGSDANNGTAKATPWKHSPFMTGSTISGYSHSSGDHFIYKGGVTWDNTCFPMDITSGGTNGNSDYHGYDITWFTGGAWARPIFDNGYVACSSHRVIGHADYITIEGIEMKRLNATDLTSNPGLLSWYPQAGALVKNCYIHGWKTTAGADSAYGGFVVGTSTPPTDLVLDSTEIENSENIGIQRSGVCVRCVAIIQNGCRIHDNSSAVLGCIDFNGSYLYNISGDGFDGVYHYNGVYLDPSFFSVSQGYIRNSYMHDCYLGANMAYPNVRSNTTVTMYNCVLYGNMSTQDAVNIDPYQYDGDTGPGNFIGYNNTIYNFSNSSAAFHVTQRTLAVTAGTGYWAAGKQVVISSIGTTNFTLLGAASNTVGLLFTINATTPTGTGTFTMPVKTLTLYNNHVINAGSFTDADTSATSAQNTITYNNGTNLSQSAATASGQGYILGNLYAPTSTSNGTYNTGTSESGTFTTDIIGITRPQASTWDIGAYEFVGPAATFNSGLSGKTVLSGSVLIK